METKIIKNHKSTTTHSKRLSKNFSEKLQPTPNERRHCENLSETCPSTKWLLRDKLCTTEMYGSFLRTLPGFHRQVCTVYQGSCIDIRFKVKDSGR